jgi:hypothetical protein
VRKYWLDTDVLIQSKNSYYSFDIARPFWDFIEQQAKAGKVCSSVRVYKEIMRCEHATDPLCKWAKERRHSGLFCEPDKDVQACFSDVGDYVVKQYSKRQSAVNSFLSGADPWIIAHAKCDHGTVVSHESRLARNALVPKIPNVCHAFGIGCIDLPTMLTTLKFTFGK